MEADGGEGIADVILMVRGRRITLLQLRSLSFFDPLRSPVKPVKTGGRANEVGTDLEGDTAGVTAALTHRGAPAGPVTPSFLAEQPNVLAFSLPVGATFAERHHLRLWTTTVQTSAGQPLWLATASFDKGFELAPSTGLPTHRIDPNIDAERAFVVTSLQSGGRVQRTQTIQLVLPEAGVNFDGDPFHTDGQAVALYLAG